MNKGMTMNQSILLCILMVITALVLVLSTVSTINIQDQRRQQVKDLEIQLADKRLELEQFKIEAVQRGYLLYDKKSGKTSWAQPTE